MVALGAAMGAPLRYWTDRFVRSRHDTVFPWGTLTVNLTACLVLGVVTGASGRLSVEATALLGTGFCGSLSTYSTFGYENQQLVLDGAQFYAVTNLVLSVVAGLGAAALGWSLGLALA